MQRIQIEMLVPDDMDPSNILERMQETAGEWFEEFADEDAYDDNGTIDVTDLENEVSVTCIEDRAPEAAARIAAIVSAFGTSGSKGRARSAAIRVIIMRKASDAVSPIAPSTAEASALMRSLMRAPCLKWNSFEPFRRNWRWLQMEEC